MESKDNDGAISPQTGYLIYMNLRRLIKKEANLLDSDDFKKVDKEFQQQHALNTAFSLSILASTFYTAYWLSSRSKAVRAGVKKASILPAVAVSTLSSMLFNRFYSGYVYESTPEMAKIINHPAYKAFLIHHGMENLYDIDKPQKQKTD